MISAIVAVDNDWGIGFNGELLEYIPEDLKHFKQLTEGHTIIMGTKTWNSLPFKPLPNRTNIIISTAQPLIMNKRTLRLSIENVVDYLSYTTDDVFIVGGGMIYKQLLSMCDKVYVTKIFKNHNQVDTYFPNLDKSNEWISTNQSSLQTYKDIEYQFWIYERI